MKKLRDLTIVFLIYILAYGVGYGACFAIDNVMLRMFTFAVAATLVTFIFSLILHNSSGTRCRPMLNTFSRAKRALYCVKALAYPN